jgi:hypothetical protein
MGWKVNLPGKVQSQTGMENIQSECMLVGGGKLGNKEKSESIIID